MSKKAVIYCRVSSEKQVREGHGIEGQELRCKQFAEQQGYTIIATFKDEGISGGLVDRPGIKQLLTFLDVNAVFETEKMGVVIDDLSRIARDVEAHFELKTAIYSRNAILLSPTHTFDESAMGKFFETIMAGSAEFYRNENRARVMKNMKSRMEKGYWPFDMPPGLKYNKEDAHGKVLRRDEPKASIIQEALEGFANRRFETQPEVQKFLESKCFTHRAKFKGTVHIEQVGRLLDRASLYAGFIEYPHWDIARRKGHHDALISPDTLQKIEERLQETARRPHRKDLNMDFPLRGFLACAHCNQLMTASWSTGRTRKYPFYRCTAKACAFRNKSVARDSVDERFRTLLQQMKPKKTAINLLEAILKDLWEKRMDILKEEQEERLKHAKEIEKEIQQLCENVTQMKSKRVIEKLEQKIEELETRKDALLLPKSKIEHPQQNFGTALKAACKLLRNADTIWNSGAFEEKRIFLNLAFTGVLPYDKQNGFGTVSFALPFALCRVSKLDKNKMVERIRFEWNQFLKIVDEWRSILNQHDAKRPKSCGT